MAADQFGVPLTVRQNWCDGEVGDYGASLVLVCPDQSVAWAGAATPGRVRRVLAWVAGHG